MDLEVLYFGENLDKAILLTLEGPPQPKPRLLEWLGLVPPRVESFFLLVVARKVSTADNSRRGIMSDNISGFFLLVG